MASRKRASAVRGARRVVDVCKVLEAIAPPALAQQWDNVGLLIGDASAAVRQLLLTIDLTGPVVREAVRRRAEMVMAYHPPIFKAISRLTPQAAPAAYAAARAQLSVYSMHTALDAAGGGTNDVLAKAIGLTQTRPLAATVGRTDCKLVVFVPPAEVARVSAAAFAAGAGRIGNYSQCSFFAPGTGTFRGDQGSRPSVGRAGRREQVEEVRLEVVTAQDQLAAVVEAIRAAHSYETPAIDVYRLEALPGGVGVGRIGQLRPAATRRAFVARVKRALGVRRVLVAGPRTGRIHTAACCAGSCGGLFKAAATAGAQAYVTGEIRHHDALAAAAAGMTVICVGHSNSERIALPELAGRIRKELPGVKVVLARADRDPLEIV